MVYPLVKFIHISAAIIWIGSIVIMSVFNFQMARKKDIAGLISLSKHEVFLGKFVIGPSAITTVLAGIYMSVFLGFGWNFWVIWGLVVILLTGIFGGTIARKLGTRIIAVANAEKIDYQQLQALQRKHNIWNLITILLLFSAVWVMIFKPVL